MEAIRVNQTLRPIRYAFMVRPGDVAGPLTAASANTALWGGIYNPIVPTDPEEGMRGLLKTFDPDYLVDLTAGTLPNSLANEFDDRIIPSSGLVHEAQRQPGKRRVNIGFGMQPVLWHVHETELHGGIKSSRVAIMKDAPEAWLPYISFVFGSFAYLPEIGTEAARAFKELASATEITFNPDEENVDYGKWLSPIDATGYGIRHYRGFGSLSTHIAYFGDHSNIGDLIEFWNIRATGREMAFLPMAHYRQHRSTLERIIKGGHYDINMGIENRADVQKAPSIQEDQVKATFEWIKTLGIGPLTYRSWSPRFGVEIDYYVGDIHAASLHASRAEETTLFDAGSLTPVKLLRPAYLNEDMPPGIHHWCVELSVPNPDTSDEWVCRLPRAQGIDRLLRRHVASGTAVRLTNSGVAIFYDFTHETASLFPVRTFEVISTLLEAATGLKVKQSHPGRYAERIIRKMGSLQFDCRVFRIRGVRDIINRLSNGSALTKGNMYDVVRSTKPDSFGQNWREDLYQLLWIDRDCAATNFTGIFEHLLEKRVIRPGLTLQCQGCFASDWYHVSEFDEEFTCRYCFGRQRVKFSSAPDWHYKSDGLFRLPRSAEGSLAVILALWWLNEVRHHCGRGRYATGLNLCTANGSVEYELDYCWLDVDCLKVPYELVLGEAKGFMDYDEEKLTKLEALAGRFQDVRPYLAIATLKDQFGDAEKAALRKLVDRGHKVIPLTRLELDPYNLYERLANAPHEHPQSFSELSESLVSVNLGP